MSYVRVLPQAFPFAALLTPDEAREAVSRIMAGRYDLTFDVDGVKHGGISEGTSFAVTVRPPYPDSPYDPPAGQVWCLWLSSASHGNLGLPTAFRLDWEH